MRKKVLVVDDEPGFTTMVGLALDQIGGYEMRETNDSTAALAVAREFQPDIILLDVMMPGMDGGDVAAQLRASVETRNVPVLFVTALVGNEEVPPGGLLRNGYRYLPKSVTFEELTRCIEESLNPAASV